MLANNDPDAIQGRDVENEGEHQKQKPGALAVAPLSLEGVRRFAAAALTHDLRVAVDRRLQEPGANRPDFLSWACSVGVAERFETETIAPETAPADDKLGALAALWQLKRWEHGGCRVFEPSAALTEQLFATDHRSLDFEHINFPFPSFAIQIPPDIDQSILCVRRKDQLAPTRLQAIFASEGVDSKGDRIWTLLLTGADVASSLSLSINAHSPLQSERISMMRLERDDAMSIVSWALSVIIYVTSQPPHSIEEGANPRALQRRIARCKNAQQRKALALKLQATGGCHRIFLGKQIARLSGAPTGTTTQNLRILVRGHWRHQAHGPKWALRRTKWIPPFWRGPRSGRSPTATTYIADVP